MINRSSQDSSLLQKNTALAAKLALPLLVHTACGGVIPIPNDGIGSTGQDAADPIETTGGFDTGVLDEGGDATGDMSIGYCWTQNDGTEEGKVHQCGGAAVITINYDNGPDNNISVPYPKQFGNGIPNDPYVLSDVSACCTPINTSLDLEDTAQFAACHADLVVHACAALDQVIAMQAQVDPQGSDPDIQADMIKIANWATEHQSDCLEQVWDDVQPVDASTGSTTWTIPVGSITGIESVESMSFALSWGIASIYLPPVNEQLSCDSYEENDKGTWSIGAYDPSDYAQTADEVDVVMLGPSYSGGTVSASGEFDGPNLLKISNVATNTWTLDTLGLYSLAPLTVGNNDATVDVSEFHMELLFPVENVSGTGSSFTVPAGAAYFNVIGKGDGIPYLLTLRNQTSIVFSLSQGKWSSGSFGLQFVDPNSDTWNLTVSAYRGWE